MEIKELQSYEVIINKHIEEVNSDAYLLKHRKTGARIVVLSNDDDNKVFNIGFRTPVTDDTGVPHIIEHTVLCGSDKFPVKEPFMELVKGSLNTFLNAMTYPDKTVYPVASYNDKDFKNLMHVYMDAVFHPNIYKQENIFKQEGWHYELDSKEGDIIINGVVYNEMKGVFSSVDGLASRVSLQSLFPDNGYSSESGGDPEYIPSLTYEQYLDFHRKYYHPSNSYIYLYGDMDVVERLEWLDKEYLSHYDYLQVDSEIKMQKSLDNPCTIKKEYAISDSEKEEESAVLVSNFVIGDSLDVELNIAFQILEYAIMKMPGAPLKQELIDAKIGKDIIGAYEDDILQPIYSITAKYANELDADKFNDLIDKTLSEIVKNGIQKDALRAGLNSLEFSVKEADFGGFPKGLIWGLNLMSTWLYDEKQPFASLETNKIFDTLREKIDTDYFESLIEKYLLNNTHRSTVIMQPKKGLTEEKESVLTEQLKNLKNSMTEEELEKLIVDTKQLKEYQETPSTDEELETIPLLEIEDIEKNPKPFIYQEEKLPAYTAVYNELFTNGIGYLDISFDFGTLPMEYVPYIGLLKYVLSFMDTDRKYTELNTDIDMNLGGLLFSSGIYVNSLEKTAKYQVEVHTKAIDNKLEKAISIIKEVITKTNFSDEKRLKEILEETKSRLNKSIIQSGNVASRMRAVSDYSEDYYIREQTSGIAFYKFVEDILEHYDMCKTEVMNKLSETIRYVFRKDNMVINYAGSRDSYKNVKGYISELQDSMYEPTDFKPHFDGWEFKPTEKNEGFITSGQVQYVSRCGNYKEEQSEFFDGSMQVLSNIMSSEYLWNNIRVLGGAYGCNCSVTRSGDVMFSSYRDPNLKRTSDVYLNAPEFIAQFDASEREMRKYIIGTISNMDTPLSAADRSGREFTQYMSGTSYEMLKREREDVLKTDVEKIRSLAPKFKKALDKNHICVVGGKSAITSDEELFNEIKELG
ncbi:MAG: insulinase family protein [Eubacterium sp.]|nr:insulinase family protein [Eubacterium sp.]